MTDQTPSEKPPADKVVKTDAEWRAELPPLAYQVTRRHGTERAFSHEGFPEGPGAFLCVGCGAPLFETGAKYDSGSGWPSFWAPHPQAPIGTTVDRSHFMTRTEVHCDRCAAHLGHLFPDGPEPTGLRYCINGAALHFAPGEPGDGAEHDG